MMSGSYDPLLVALSFIIAALASYAALDLAGRVRSAEGSTRLGWLAGGATVMGLGIWSMHFVGMLAFSLPVPITYELQQMLLSVAVAIGASLLALVVVSRMALRAPMLIVGGIIMGGAIAGMHYIGMASMAVSATLSYSAPIVAISIVIAIVASWVALGLAFSFRTNVGARGVQLKSMSAAVMGVAIAGMHYVGMAAVRFAPHTIPTSHTTHIVATGALAAGIVVGITVIIALALVGAVIDRNIQSKVEFTKQLKDMNGALQRSLADAERAREELAEQHETNLELQRVAQQEAVKARLLAGIAETATALAHEINNPLTVLMMNTDLLEDSDFDHSAETVAQIRGAANRIAGVVQRLTSVETPRTVRYIGESRMLDLSGEEEQ
jgi:NO-binding membrane sensor protein with MHYT domain